MSIWVTGAVATVIGIAMALLMVGKGGDNILKATPSTAPKPKRYIAWNKDRMIRDTRPSSMSVNMLSALGAKNIEQMESINGYSFEADGEVELKIKAVTLTQKTSWVIQEEVEYQILPFQCSRCETINCPDNPSPAPNPSPVPNPSPGPGTGPIEADKSWGRGRVRAIEAQKIVDTSKVKVCVVDTGIDMNHPNKGNVIATKDFTGKGSAQDGNGHGTHTAGTVGGTGGVGISRAGLLVCKGLDDSGSGTSTALAQCLVWCGQNGAQIVSNSWGSSQSDPIINQAVSQLTGKGIYVMVANGNDGGAVNWPAKLSGSNPLVYAIAASDQADRLAVFSSRGPETKAIAPGVAIKSNVPGGGLAEYSGTSMATPHAAGVCAFGVARGRKPCIAFSGLVGGYQMVDALESAK